MITKYHLRLGAPQLSNDHVTCWTCPHGFAKNETCLSDPEDQGRANTCRLGFQDACLTLIIGINRVISKCALVLNVDLFMHIFNIFDMIIY